MAIDKNFIMGYGAGKASKTSQTIIEETDAWLEENISQETGYVLDRTLTLQNAAAPADLVGDLKSALTHLATVKVPFVVAGSFWNTESTTAVYKRISADWICNQTPIKVYPNEIYIVKGIQGATHKTRIWVVTDESYNIISEADDYYSTNESENTDTLVIPDSGKYLLITTRLRSGDPVSEVKKYIPNTWCYGKKINWLGDSIVADNDFDEIVSSTLGITETDYGIGGSTIAKKGDGTNTRYAICLRYTEMNDTADIVAVSCGTNDFEYAWSPIGDINSTETTTFYGALKTLCEGLINKYPDKVIFFTTPIKRAQAFANGDGGEYTQDGVMLTPFSKNKYGKTLKDYCDIIKEVCSYYSIPVLDLYSESLLNPHITSQQNLFSDSYTHPNNDGMRIMARRVIGWLSQLGSNPNIPFYHNS